MDTRLLDTTPAAVPDQPPGGPSADSYRRLAEVFHEVMSEQDLGALLERIAVTLADLMPYEALHIYEAHEEDRELVPVFARSPDHMDEIMADRPRFDEGLTGWAVSNRSAVWTNRADLDPRTAVIPGTRSEPEAVIVVPLIARSALKGALNIYRLGDGAAFDTHEFELAKLFGDAAALALDNAQVRARLEYLAQTDSLTGLYNHRYFYERLRSELTRASRSHDSVAVLMFDLDDFKRTNDVYGHGAGDQLLIQLARLARDTVRGSDVVCRVGGEEFGVIMPSCDSGDAFGLANRFRERIAETEFELALHVTVSIGVARGPRDAMSPRELVACAESAMMAAKARGKNQTVLYDDGTSERPDVERDAVTNARDVRSVAHLKMLQSLAGKLNRSNDVRVIAETISTELRMLIDYHNCRVVLRRDDDLYPIAYVGDDERETVPYAYAVRVGEGITGRAVETGEPQLVPNALECDFAIRIPGTEELEESIVAVPLRYGARVTGAIVISKLGTGQFDEDDVRLLEVLAGQASVALENARLYELQRREALSARALLAFADELSVAETFDEICAVSVVTAAAHFGTGVATLWLEGRCVAGSGSAELGRVTAPISAGDGLDGVLSVGDRELDEERRRQLVSFAHQVSVALHKARLYERQLEATETANALLGSTVAALANALEANDRYTSSHARWMTEATVAVGRALALDDETMTRLELGALFHDIGKIGVPSGILQKPGPLTDEEFAVVKEHPELGERILAPIERLAHVRPVVRSCHEHWDGSGYPDGSAGEAIPVEARIVLVCDAFHAMTTDRPYRAALPVEEALGRLHAAAGTQFEPLAVETFTRLWSDGAIPPPR